MPRSKRVLVVLVSAVVVLAIAVFVWAPAWFVPNPRAGSDAAREPRTGGVTEKFTTPPIEAHAIDEARRAIENAPSSAAALDAAPSSQSNAVFLHVKVDDNPWLAEHCDGRLVWSDATGARAEYRLDHGSVVLPSMPRAIEEFSELTVGGLVAVPVALERMERRAGDGTDAVSLTAELASGAQLEWASSVPTEARSRVDLALGGYFAPPPGDGERDDRPDAFVDRVVAVELPIALPRPVKPLTIWVRSEGHRWRGFYFDHDTERVAVALERTATVRVLHDEKGPATVVVTCLPLSQDVRVPLAPSDEPVEIADLSAGLTAVWIERSKKRRSRVVRVELVAGGTAEVDLRSTASFDGLGAIQLLVRTPANIDAQTLNKLAAHVARDTTFDPTATFSTIGPMMLIGSDDTEHSFHATGFEPVRHVVELQPFGIRIDVDVEAGTTTFAEIELDCFGSARFQLPPEIPDVSRWIDVEGHTTGSGQRVRTRLDVREGRGDVCVIACGTYTARGKAFFDHEYVVFESKRFVVGPFDEVSVPMVARRAPVLTVTVVDSETGDPVGFDIDFWNRVWIVDAASEKGVGKLIGISGPGGAYHTNRWSIEASVGPARLNLPENPFWTFELPDGPLPRETATVTVRATAK